MFDEGLVAFSKSLMGKATKRLQIYKGHGTFKFSGRRFNDFEYHSNSARYLVATVKCYCYKQ